MTTTTTTNLAAASKRSASSKPVVLVVSSVSNAMVLILASPVFAQAKSANTVSPRSVVRPKARHVEEARRLNAKRKRNCRLLARTSTKQLRTCQYSRLEIMLFQGQQKDLQDRLRVHRHQLSQSRNGAVPLHLFPVVVLLLRDTPICIRAHLDLTNKLNSTPVHPAQQRTMLLTRLTHITSPTRHPPPIPGSSYRTDSHRTTADGSVGSPNYGAGASTSSPSGYYPPHSILLDTIQLPHPTRRPNSAPRHSIVVAAAVLVSYVLLLVPRIDDCLRSTFTALVPPIGRPRRRATTEGCPSHQTRSIRPCQVDRWKQADSQISRGSYARKTSPTASSLAYPASAGGHPSQGGTGVASDPSRYDHRAAPPSTQPPASAPWQSGQTAAPLQQNNQVSEATSVISRPAGIRHPQTTNNNQLHVEGTLLQLQHDRDRDRNRRAPFVSTSTGTSATGRPYDTSDDVNLEPLLWVEPEMAAETRQSLWRFPHQTRDPTADPGTSVHHLLGHRTDHLACTVQASTLFGQGTTSSIRKSIRCCTMPLARSQR